MNPPPRARDAAHFATGLVILAAGIALTVPSRIKRAGFHHQLADRRAARDAAAKPNPESEEK
ncbi:hypothetical protein [Amycolatopsis taiwanensis]|uniref:hypothetical protein n=1 Tax=Amycolatopsis taiwanensis TaxID=342230 RepID=UPI0004843A05|nr:hypothetical protein [Amycolatopsis taiwanensis]